MFIVYKFAIIVTVLTILSYVLSVPFTFLFAVILVIICCDSDFQEFGYNFVANLKVKNGTKKSSTSFKTQNRSNWYSSTPNMQNSRFNKYNCTFSPISKSANGISRNISNGITSTPIPSSTPYIQNSIFSPPRMTTLRSPPRYLLSDVSSVSPPVTSIKSPKPVQKVSGPLLASTRFNVSLGTYTDSKSPGLVNRIVQYDTEAKEKHTPTHQAKYGSPGVFPIVHFFKKDIPVISPKPKKVTVRIASPDTSLYDNSRYGRNFINDRGDTINGHSREPEESDASTRSVLDALKEISRKRIHSSTEFESNQDSCKRQKRNDCMNNSFEYNKQTSDELPVQETTPSSSFTQPIPDKICVVDIIAASFSSSNLLKERIEKGLKRKAELEDLEQAEHKKQIKLKNAETQTTEKIKKKPTLRIYQPLESASTTSTLSDSREKEIEEEKPKEHVVQRYNMFDEKKLEIHKKNKLATLLSAITGEKPVLLPYETVETTKSDSKPVSILSPQNKPKHDKHVSFNLPPESVSDALSTSENVKPLEPPDTSSIMTTPTKNNASDNLIIAETPKNMPSMPLKLNFNANIMDSTFNNPDTKSSSINFTPIDKSLAPTQMTHVMSDSPITSQAQVTSETLKIDNSKPSLTFGPISSTAAMSCSPVESNNQQFNFGVTPTTETKSTPTKQGGFKFDFNKTTSPQDLTQAKSITKTITSPVLSFNASNASPKPLFASAAPIPPLNNNSFVAPQHNTNPPTYNFASNNSLNKQMFPTSNNSSAIPIITSSAASPPMFGANTLPGSLQRPQFSNTTGSFNASTIGLPPPNASTFGKTAPTAFGTSATNTFGTVSAPSTSAGAFGTNSTTPAFGTMSAPTFSTASAMTFVSSSGFGPTTGFNNTATAPTFGSNVFNSTTTPSLFPITTVTPAFGGALPTFGNAVTTSMPVFSTGTKPFGTPNTTSTQLFGTTTATAAFGTAVATSVPMFMTTTTTSTPVFGATTTSTPMFGNNNPKNATGFISTSPPLFGTNTITTTGFGTNPAPTMGFGANAAPFGSNSAASTQNFSAGATKSTLFAPNTNAVTFVSTTTSASTFGTSAPSKGFSFGSNTGAVAPSFGTNRTNGPFNFNPVSTTSAPGFTATKATPSFGSNFNVPPNQAPFGTTQSLTTPISSANIFGSSTSSFGTGPSTFGAKSDNFAANTGFNNNFGNGQPFGANTGNANFGGSSNNFGNTPGNTQALGFGGGDNSAFAKPQAPSNVFGNPGSGDNTIQFGNNVPGVVNSAQPTFGSSNTANIPAPGQSTVFSFGPSNQPVSPPVGAVFSFGSNDAPKPNFNFSSGANPTPGFGATSPIFGTTQTPNYNSNNPQFGTPVGTFSIGSGSSNRSRTQLKAKRRA